MGRKVRHGASLEERLADGIEWSGGGCLVWGKARNGSGYGLVTLPGGGQMVAHRAMYEVAIGPVPDGLELDHLCRNKSCVNPSHLEPVTRAENVRRGWHDRRARGNVTRMTGTANPASKLTDEQVAQIRARIGTDPQWRIGREFGVSQMTVSRIARGEAYA